MTKLMSNKKGIVFGVSNKRGIGYAIAKKLFDEGADIAFTYAGDIMKDRRASLACTTIWARQRGGGCKSTSTGPPCASRRRRRGRPSRATARRLPRPAVVM